MRAGRKPRIVKKSELNRLLDLRSAGYSFRQLEDEFECSRMAIWRAIRRAGEIDWEYEYCTTTLG